MQQQVEVLQRATVCVIQSASQATHWPADRENLRAVEGRLPWLVFEFFDETHLQKLFNDELSSRFAAVIVTAGAMQLKAVRDEITRNSALIEATLRAGTGFLISVPFLTDSERFDLTFLPKERQVSVISLPSTKYLKGTLRVLDRDTVEVDSDLDAQHITRVVINASHSTGWREFAVFSDGVDKECVAWRSQVGPGRLLVTTIPFERLKAPSVLDEVLTRITRSRCNLVVGEDPVPRWFREAPGGSGLAQVTETNPNNVAVLRRFSHLRFTEANQATAWGMDRDALMLRLENDGSVEFPSTDLLDDRIYVRFAGVPRYLQLLRQLEPRILKAVDVLERGPTFGTLAYAVAVDSASRVVRDGTLIPDILRKTSAQKICAQALRARVHNGHVDKLLLPTVNLYVAASLVGVDDPVRADMYKWIMINSPLADSDQRAQARWVGRLDLQTSINEVIPVPESAQSLVGRMSIDEDRGELNTATYKIESVSPLESALISFAHERNAADSDAFLQVSSLEADLITVGNVEANLYSLAAELLRERREWLRVGNLMVASSSESPIVHESESDLLAVKALTARAEASVALLRVEQLEEQIHKLSRVGSPVLGLMMALVLVGFGVGVWLAWRFQPEIGAAVLATNMLIFGYLCLRVSEIDWLRTVTPKWVKVVPEVLKRSQ